MRSRSCDLCRHDAAVKENEEVLGCSGGGWHPPASGARLRGLCRSARIDVPGGIGQCHDIGEQGLAFEGPSR